MQTLTSQNSPYVGRFAPSPTGVLHMGSLMAAVASYLDARKNGGQWLLRIEDLDPPREVPGAAQSILSTLERFGFEWDGAVLWQSQRELRYRAMLERLIEAGAAYQCTCTRKMIQSDGLLGIDGARYVGRCRERSMMETVKAAYRIKVSNDLLEVVDRVQGVVSQRLFDDLGDFVIRRADGLWAYQLAVVVDDADSGVTHIVRGADLLDSTPRQRYVQQVLNLYQPQYLHIPVITNSRGEKLSKQTLAPALLSSNEAAQLWQALYLLWQQPLIDMKAAPLFELWEWALESWDVAKIPQKRSVAVTIDRKNEYKFL
ncbi:tRNA glutamyl-Q(34) synthetase GluQRS [Chitinibacter bivalviorum]|uniref:Glutamyl-Q tRNA(Asp) synthetase n=1 Tax=Chitinibacter bivalviorum TaxID=2739434 RepID=A0A7H9BIE2_9NEIS|nr:tRNA glutamyl-Q(34) synthetase GluQRS [Chitinibacter bivalviorum]QLG87721.1 tRNA glutamyl-Q(34) synthetase GluQRS [Chitinibacter bivalviorum]